MAKTASDPPSLKITFALEGPAMAIWQSIPVMVDGKPCKDPSAVAKKVFADWLRHNARL
jgi:hypothetical protein